MAATVGISVNGSSQIQTIGLTGNSQTDTITYSLPGSHGSALSALVLVIYNSDGSTSNSYTLPFTISGNSATGSFQIPLEVANTYPNSSNGKAMIQSFYGGTQASNLLYTQEVDLTFTSEIYLPTGTLSLSEENPDIGKKFGAYVVGHSQLIFNYTSAAKYGATITKAQLNQSAHMPIQLDSSLSTYQETAGIGGNFVGSISFTDSRGNKTSNANSPEVSCTILDYSNPQISDVKIQRCDNQGTPNIAGVYSLITLSGTITALNDKNDKSVTIKYRETGTTDWTTMDATQYMNGYDISASILVGTGNFEIDKTYDLEIDVTDYFASTSYTGTIPTSTILLNIAADGSGVGIGKEHERGILDIKGNVFIDGDLSLDSMTISNKLTLQDIGLLDFIYPIGAYYISDDSTSPEDLFGGTWIAITGRTLIGVDPDDSDFDSPGKYAGEKTHTLTVSEMPAHTHTQNAHTHSLQMQRADKTVSNYGLQSGGGFTNMPMVQQGSSNFVNSATATNNNTGGGQAHNNLPPYFTAYMWHRTA